MADSAGLALVVAREPGDRRRRMPVRLVMTPDMLPEGNYTALLGQSAGGDVVLDLAAGERAILVGGTTGAGKTCTISSLVLQLAHKCSPNELALALVDLKRLDFPPLAGLPHLVKPVATIEAEAIDLVRWCYQEMERRQTVMGAAQVTRWDRMPEDERFPLLLLVVDEIADFANSSVMGDLVKLARKSRASGIALITAT
ncbi:MAG: FtsK/SpoIIIE domain-containing protein, partial [Anaerolineae bacterium]